MLRNSKSAVSVVTRIAKTHTASMHKEAAVVVHFVLLQQLNQLQRLRFEVER